ncbi:MAG: hypothetical protein O7D91_01110 [Planctomycetota bacterium]|nr:hypothetical protein [Planctomycetota bacterium]
MRWHTHVCTIVFAGLAFTTTSPTYAEGPANEWAVVEAYALANISAEDGARLIRELIPAGTDFDVVADARSNSLIVAGPPRIQERVAQAVADLDLRRLEPAVLEGFDDAEPLPAGPKLQARVVKLSHVDCEEVARQVRSLFESEDGHRKATWFGPGNAVLLRSTAAELDQMVAIIAQLDVPTADGKPAQPRVETTVIYVRHAVANELASVLWDLADSRRGGRRGSSAPRVIVEERLNSLVLKGSPDQVADLKILIEQLDVPAGPLPVGDL